MTHDRLSLKNVKINSAVSQETNCFSASIYLDGKKVGTARNHGNGGPNFYDWEDRQAGAEVEAYADAQTLEFDFEKLDQIVEGMLAQHAEDRQVTVWCRTRLVYRRADTPNGSWITVKCADTPANRAAIAVCPGGPITEWANDRFLSKVRI